MFFPLLEKIVKKSVKNRDHFTYFQCEKNQHFQKKSEIFCNKGKIFRISKKTKKFFF